MSDATRIRPPGDARRGAEEASLVVVEGDAALGLRVPLRDEVVLGRDPECAVRLPADDVSRRHARVSPDGAGHVVVDLGSTNGTWVNGREVEVQRLVSGDRIRIGPFVARYAATGDADARDLEDLARLARRDALTDLPNRRAFQEELARAVARATRGGMALAVVVLDVDHFKRVNDSHGHAAGDAVLRAVASCVANVLRAGDLLARIGGEEFAAVLPGADLARAADAAHRIRAAIAEGRTAAGDASLAVTASVGCAALRPGEDGAALLARADAKLYEAKGEGRNRVAF